jgi:DNA-binding transcriptional MerR regulator
MATTAPRVYGVGRDASGFDMTQPRTLKESWAAWLPLDAPEPATDDLLSKDELIAELRSRGVVVSPRLLTFWQEANVLPAPFRRNVDGVSQARFPPAAVEVIVALRRLQATGYSLADIGERLRAAAKPLVQAGASDRMAIGMGEAAGVREFREPTDDDMVSALAAARARFEAVSGLAATKLALEIEDSTGRSRTYRLTSPDDQ